MGIHAALVKAQAEIGAALKDSTNPHFKSKYADLASVVAAIKPVAAKHGLGYVQKFHPADGGVCIETIIVHESGEQIETGPLFVPASKQDAQGYGSAITYTRRYSLQTAFGVPADDDDGNAASKVVISPVKESAKGLDADPIKVAKVVTALVNVQTLEAEGSLDDADWAYVEQVDTLTQDEKLAVWAALAGNSKLRSRVKEAQKSINARAAAAA